MRYDSPPGKALLERLKCEQEQQLQKLKDDMAFQVNGVAAVCVTIHHV